MSASQEYLARLQTLELNDGSLPEAWEVMRAEYVLEDGNFLSHALRILAERALTIVATYLCEQDMIAAKRPIEWWFGLLIGEMGQLHRNKNAGYSGRNKDPWHNFKVCNSFGVTTEDGIIARMCDKYARYDNVSQDATLDKVGESAIDTLKDLAAYALILSVIIEETP